MTDADIDGVVAQIRGSKRYRGVGEALVRRVVELEARHHHGRELGKAARRHLHRIYGAYLPTRPRFDRLLEQLQAAKQDGSVRELLLRIMSQHASTRERVPVMDAFMQQLDARLGPVDSVLDLACGLQPLAAPWWPSCGRMIARDIDEQLLEFLDEALDILGVEHEVGFVDLHVHAPLPRADVALLLKTLPCLAPELSGSFAELLARIDAPIKVVSFPTRSLGGREKGMRSNYAQLFEATLAEVEGSWDSFEVPGELVYILRAGDPTGARTRRDEP